MAYGLAGGLAAGISEGARLVGDAEDRKLRQELGKRQIEAADLQLAKEREDAEYRASLKRLYEERDQAAKGGTTGDVTDEFGVTIPGLTYMGDNRPEAGGLQFTGETKRVAPKTIENDPVFAQEMLSKANALKVKYGKMDDVQAMEAMNKFNTLQKAGVFDAGFSFLSGTLSENDALAMMRKKMPVPDGTRLVRTTEKLIPDDPNSPVRPSFKVVAPDGNVVADWGTISRSVLSPKDLAENEFRVLDTAVKLKHYGDQALHWKALEGIEGKKLDNQLAANKITLERLEQAGRRDIERLQMQRDEAAARKLQQTMTGAVREIQTLSGFTPMKDDALIGLPAEEKKNYWERARVVNGAMDFYELNLNERGVPTIHPAKSLELSNAFVTATKDPKEAAKWNAKVKIDPQRQLPYMDIDGKKVFVMRAPEPEAPAAGGAPGAPQRPGIRPPSEPVPNRDYDRLPREAQAIGESVDKARADAAAANSELLRWGSTQRQKDPAGYAAAVKKRDDAEAALAAANSAWSRAVGQ